MNPGFFKHPSLQHGHGAAAAVAVCMVEVFDALPRRAHKLTGWRRFFRKWPRAACFELFERGDDLHLQLLEPGFGARPLVGAIGKKRARAHRSIGLELSAPTGGGSAA